MQSFSAEQYRALRTGVALLDRSDRGRIAASGADRLAYLHALLTNDVAALRPGTGCYAAYLTPQGRMVADMIVLELGDLTLLDVEPTARAVVLEKLEQFIFTEDVRLSDLTSDLAEFRVAGPRAPELLSAVLPSTAQQGFSLAEYQSVRTSFNDASVVIAGSRELGVPGLDVYIARTASGAFESAVVAAGARRASAETADVLRVEAGRPRFGVDMDETTIPLEAGIEPRAISFTKGCYPGQEVITRVLHRGHGRIARKLAGLACDGATVPAAGDAIVAGDREAGKVTSAALSPALGRPIALGYVQRDFIAAGTTLFIVHQGERVPATVVDLPFVQPD